MDFLIDEINNHLIITHDNSKEKNLVKDLVEVNHDSNLCGYQIETQQDAALD